MHSGSNKLGSNGTYRFILKLLLSAVLLFKHLVLSPEARAEDVPAFVVDATISTKLFWPGEPNPREVSEANILFLSSNNWWQVEAKYPDKNGRVVVQNCMTVPGGTRRYVVFDDKSLYTNKSNALTAATVCPLDFPSPGLAALFAGWLTYCPNAKLPMIDHARMRRFITVPSCNADLINDPQNYGSFLLRYTDEKRIFLSDLVVTNNGISLDVTVNEKSDIYPFRPPFENGFLDFKFEVRETTNVAGLTFPLRTILKRYNRKPQAKTRDDIYVRVSSEIITRNISLWQGPASSVSEVPVQLLAMDQRPPLPPGRSVNYLVTNDQWRSASDPYILGLAAHVKKMSNEHVQKKKTSGILTVIVFLGVCFVLPAGFLLIKKLNKVD